MQGLFASLEDYDLQNTTVPEVDDGDVVEMFEAAQEVGREVEADTAQAQDAMAVVEALENYRELLKRELALGDGVNRATTRAIEIGVEALTARYRDEDGAPLAWSMESFDTPGQAVRATQASLEGIGDIMKTIGEKAKNFAKRARDGIMKASRAISNFFGTVKGRAQKLRKEVESKDFEPKQLKAGSYANIAQNGEMNLAVTISNMQKFIDNFVVGDKFLQPLKDLDNLVNEAAEKIEPGISGKEVARIIQETITQAKTKFKVGGFKDGVFKVSDNLTIEFAGWPLGKEMLYSFDIVNQKAKPQGETESVSKDEAIAALDKIIAQAETLESYTWDDMLYKAERMLGLTDKSQEEAPTVDEMKDEEDNSPRKLSMVRSVFANTMRVGLLLNLINERFVDIITFGLIPDWYKVFTRHLAGYASLMNPFFLAIGFLMTLIKGATTVEEMKKMEDYMNVSNENLEGKDTQAVAAAEKESIRMNAALIDFIVECLDTAQWASKAVYMDGMDYIQDSM